MTAIEQLQNILHPPLRDILSGFEGVVRPGEMLRRGIFLSSYSNLAQAILFQLFLDVLVQGCSTFLKTIANQRDEYYSIEGRCPLRFAHTRGGGQVLSR